VNGGDKQKVTKGKLRSFARKWYHYADCAAFGQYMRSKSRYIGNLKDLVAEYWADNTQQSH
jgi:hypothetical protein